jgi:hypothetical protein
LPRTELERHARKGKHPSACHDQVSDTYLWNVVKNDLPILEQSVEEAIKVLQNQPE